MYHFIGHTSIFRGLGASAGCSMKESALMLSYVTVMTSDG